MKRKRFSTEQIVAVLKQAEQGRPVADLIQLMGNSEQTFYQWKKQYAGLESDHVRELTQLVDEIARLKKLISELSENSGAKIDRGSGGLVRLRTA
jgi:putative transposase